MTHVFNAGVDYPGLGLCNILGRCGFAVQVKKDFPILTKDDIRIILLLRIELSHEDIARLCNIQLSSFRKRRSRLKKKMNIECDSISEFIKEMYCSPLSIPRS